jgi:hypothetical protein
MQHVGDYIIEKIRERSRIQGHTLTGKFEAGLRAKIREDGNRILIIGIDESGVGKYLDEHVQSSQIPYSRGSGAGKSLFIDGLTRYAEQRFGLSGREALGAAFAMATKMKREGKPTLGSYRFTQNQRRVGVITDTLNDEKDNIRRLIFERAGRDIKIQFQNIIRKNVKQWQ